MLEYQQTPVQEIAHPLCEASGIRLLVKREDLNHPTVSGNKWWKLKNNLEVAAATRHRRMLTFGGAYSNHIYATAAAASLTGLASIGIIRGEETLPLNPTLHFAAARGMQLHYVSRGEYRSKNSAAFIDRLHRQFGDFVVVPEGGSNALAVKGCAEFAEKELSSIAFDYLVLPVGTGGTMAGLICGLQGRGNILGISVLKQGEFLKKEVADMVTTCYGHGLENWTILTNHHEGGYAKTSSALLTLIEEWRTKYNIPLDHVYTGKLFLAVMREMLAGTFSRGSTVLLLHTGGLQGMLSLNKEP